MTDTPPVFEGFLTHDVALAIVMHLRNLKSVASSQKRSRYPDHVPFGVYPLGWDFPLLIHLQNLNIPEILMAKIYGPDHAHFDGKFLLLGWELP